MFCKKSALPPYSDWANLFWTFWIQKHLTFLMVPWCNEHLYFEKNARLSTLQVFSTIYLFAVWFTVGPCLSSNNCSKCVSDSPGYCPSMVNLCHLRHAAVGGRDQLSLDQDQSLSITPHSFSFPVYPSIINTSHSFGSDVRVQPLISTDFYCNNFSSNVLTVINLNPSRN